MLFRSHPRRDEVAVKSFTVLVREHSLMLLTYLRSSVEDPGAVDDLFQETMVTAWRRFGDYDVDRAFSRWLRGIARVNVTAYWRRVGRRAEIEGLQALDQVEAQMSVHDGRGDDAWQEQFDQLTRCVEELSDELRSTVTMHYREGHGTQEVARLLKCSVESVRKRLQRARARLAACLEARRSGGSSSTADATGHRASKLGVEGA